MLRSCFWHSFHVIKQQEKSLCYERPGLLSNAVMYQNSGVVEEEKGLMESANFPILFPVKDGYAVLKDAMLVPLVKVSK